MFMRRQRETWACEASSQAVRTGPTTHDSMGKKIQIWAFLDNFPYILPLKNHSCDSGSFPIKFICALWLIQFKGTLGNLLTSQTLSEVRSSCGDVSSLVVVLATSIFISVAAVLLFFKFSYSCFVYFFLPAANLRENITSSFLNYVSMSGSAREFAHTSAGSLEGQKRTSGSGKLESQRVLDGLIWILCKSDEHS